MKPRALSSLLLSIVLTLPTLGLTQRLTADTEAPATPEPASGQSPREHMRRITIRIYDFDHLEPVLIAKAKGVTSEIFRKAGIEISWVECASQDRCVTDAEGPEFRVRIVPPLIGNAMVSDDSLGFAIPCAGKEEACLCYLFGWKIRALAERVHIRSDVLLGHVMAHEIGHALLGTKAHELSGLMQHNLPVRETERTLYFTSGQAKHLRADLLAREAGAVRRNHLMH